MTNSICMVKETKKKEKRMWNEENGGHQQSFKVFGQNHMDYTIFNIST